jgi:FMN reductase
MGIPILHPGKNQGKRPMTTMCTINGSPTKRSKTGALVEAIGDAIAHVIPVERRGISLADVGHEVMCGLTRPGITAEGEKLLRLAETSDIIVVGSPMYRASYTGLLKHFFDLIERDAIRNCKAVLCATGANQMHTLALEHQMRPLMAFFSIHTTPTAVYGTGEDFTDGVVSSQSLKEKIERAAHEMADLVSISPSVPRGRG